MIDATTTPWILVTDSSGQKIRISAEELLKSPFSYSLSGSALEDYSALRMCLTLLWDEFESIRKEMSHTSFNQWVMNSIQSKNMLGIDVERGLQANRHMFAIPVAECLSQYDSQIPKGAKTGAYTIQSLDAFYPAASSQIWKQTMPTHMQSDDTSVQLCAGWVVSGYFGNVRKFGGSGGWNSGAGKLVGRATTKAIVFATAATWGETILLNNPMLVENHESFVRYSKRVFGELMWNDINACYIEDAQFIRVYQIKSPNEDIVPSTEVKKRYRDPHSMYALSSGKVSNIRRCYSPSKNSGAWISVFATFAPSKGHGTSYFQPAFATICLQNPGELSELCPGLEVQCIETRSKQGGKPGLHDLVMVNKVDLSSVFGRLRTENNYMLFSSAVMESYESIQRIAAIVEPSPERRQEITSSALSAMSSTLARESESISDVFARGCGILQTTPLPPDTMKRVNLIIGKTMKNLEQINECIDASLIEEGHEVASSNTNRRRLWMNSKMPGVSDVLKSIHQTASRPGANTRIAACDVATNLADTRFLVAIQPVLDYALLSCKMEKQNGVELKWLSQAISAAYEEDPNPRWTSKILNPHPHNAVIEMVHWLQRHGQYCHPNSIIKWVYALSCGQPAVRQSALTEISKYL